ncbi:MAG: hypothetical protein A3I07_01325 [Candidatus Doudnabacteria bacterium RIFCSPLOWO2_02_FULL_42_9]|uniref:Type II secretion system protein GspG C-terminal domain-containing protein n=1 Tax=Candidatus Doudnabacteria bacterium RIFCSPHIGHO2_01_FULL_41_86 TaxID=1817821 RepID=A0A1F5N956_9BACT|nr:MAG: hypothetical protein A2717_00885 [Candidatus Doudnabacteria bacterium RIFCSPHIGHO2_01_FULL_41_86]OGE75398.1 MAG: hypothetical protein A3K07_01400 [Candidatus Doudnabacteria bacterium RIFCSPHIGHO2_01_43_10]OGE86576.1 MAG: hypothetical protein A3E28_04170 [Candidatus Doudnabacteria bacterium RIFCSPHIGHO2_12_FULL_42_22]OGE87476.1 MAG: hypothetical protein A3C49_03830 [Candidatus Doudnabacteria bacterium RIFCSPHIGHO2_02_FULL_42_25]OGE92789.1 MAG: hypothetical protein A2895_04685 [Candidatus
MFNFKSQGSKGFTLIELLVVIAIIGILAAVVLVSLNSARAKSRDARRLADVRQIMTALELYYNDCGGYPDDDVNPPAPITTVGIAALQDEVSDGTPCTSAGTTFGTFLATIPSNPTPADPSALIYTYSSASNTEYTITFGLEGTSGGFGPGLVTASEKGLQ